MAQDKLIGNWTADNELTLRASGEDPAAFAELAQFLPKYTAVFTDSEITLDGFKKNTQVIPYRITEAEGSTLRGDIAGGQAELQIDFETEDRILMRFDGQPFGLKRA